jgi:hypothetical protein
MMYLLNFTIFPKLDGTFKASLVSEKLATHNASPCVRHPMPLARRAMAPQMT